MDGGGEAGPGEAELAEGREDSTEGHDASRGFGKDGACFGVSRLRVDDAAEEGFAEDDDEGADADAAKGEAGHTWGPTAMLGEDDGVGEETEVENRINEGDPVGMLGLYFSS